MDTSTGWLREPLVPVTRSVKAPVEAVELTVTVRVEDAEAPLGGVTGFGLNPCVTPLGVVPIQEPDKVTGELKPFSDVTVIIEVKDAEPDVGRAIKND